MRVWDSAMTFFHCKQVLIEDVHLFRPILYDICHLANGIHGFIKAVFRQPAAFSPELSQFGADGIHADGAGIGIQQAVSPQGADFMVFFRCFRNRLVNHQHFGIILPQDGFQGVQLIP